VTNDPPGLDGTRLNIEKQKLHVRQPVTAFLLRAFVPFLIAPAHSHKGYSD
jgi:hypothetical protein